MNDDPIVNAANNGTSHEAPMMMFDCLPPGKYSPDGSGTRVGDAMSFPAHARTMTKFLLELADYAQQDGHPVRYVVVDLFLLRMFTFQPGSNLRGRLDVGKNERRLDGTWRGYPVYVDGRFLEGRGCFVSENDHVAALLHTHNISDGRTRFAVIDAR